MPYATLWIQEPNPVTMNRIIALIAAKLILLGGLTAIVVWYSMG